MSNNSENSKNIYLAKITATAEIRRILLTFSLMMVILAGAYYLSRTTPYLKTITDRVYSFLNF